MKDYTEKRTALGFSRTFALQAGRGTLETFEELEKVKPVKKKANKFVVDCRMLHDIK